MSKCELGTQTDSTEVIGGKTRKEYMTDWYQQNREKILIRAKQKREGRGELEKLKIKLYSAKYNYKQVPTEKRKKHIENLEQLIEEKMKTS